MALSLRLVAAALLALLLALVKLASESGLALPEILFWRQLPTIALIPLFLWLQRSLKKLSTQRLPQHGVRAAIGIVAMSLNFGAVTLLPLAEATTFGFTSAIWAVILSAIVLRERVGLWRWSAVTLGFLGVIIIAQPGDGHVPLFGAAVALASAFTIAIISIYIRDLAQTEDSITIVFYFALFTTPLLTLVLPWFWTAKSPEQWALLGAIGLVGLVGQILLTAALRFGQVASVIVMDYSSLVWATLLGWAVFDRLPPAITWIGAPLIIGAGLLIAWREHRLALGPRANLANG
ncbi:DMT family transporter [Altererythrobacter arenosus]|uniref:DMT family transporter n=1 Tax=Altererythrobacter arenosus TaxID=3032592 RepID=A0ABY8FS87_9SPHN|nr:DMT family transporter [Altererythrobacter sp. CAU 1644]WFL77877.1 DMT family transporter [Altererythrobacter sp. CAU 1644]